MHLNRPCLALAAALVASSLPACTPDGRDGSTAGGATAPTGATASDSATVTATASSSGESSGATGGEASSGSSAASAPTGTAATDTSGDPGTTGTTGAATTSIGTTGAETSGGAEVGCERVDFLFVIDNSSSMEAKQAALKAAFPSFINTIKATVKAQDYHIMVIDTDAWGKCTNAECNKGPDKNEVCNAYICNTEFTQCDKTFGAGVVHPAGKASSNTLCEIHGDNRYLLADDPNLTDTFSCVAKLGLAGNGMERPLDALMAALSSPANNDPGGCNEGFLRDDAILVITMISDDPNKVDVTDPKVAYDAVVARKGGDPDRTVVLGLIPDPSMNCPADKPTAGVHWAEFISYFGERGIKGPVCAPDYSAFFQQAVSTIDQACAINPG